MVNNLKEASLYSHLEELRKMLIISLAAVAVGTVISYLLLLEYIMNIFMAPMDYLGQELVFIAVGESFITQLKLAIFGGIMISSPVCLWQLLSFVSPALYAKEKKVLYVTLFFATLLFLTGIIFSYSCLLLPGLKLFLINFSAGLTPLVSIGSYVSFVFCFLLPFGLVFEIPVVVFFLSLLGILNLVLRKKRNM